jgi:hypothetical protein
MRVLSRVLQILALVGLDLVQRVEARGLAVAPVWVRGYVDLREGLACVMGKRMQSKRWSTYAKQNIYVLLWHRGSCKADAGQEGSCYKLVCVHDEEGWMGSCSLGLKDGCGKNPSTEDMVVVMASYTRIPGGGLS